MIEDHGSRIMDTAHCPLIQYLCTMSSSRNIRHLTLDELKTYFEGLGEPKFRVKQVWEWLWQKHAHSFAEMTNLSKDLRAKLGEQFTLPALTVDATQYSADGTVKTRFRTHDGHLIEGVLIPTSDRLTACVSSQIGCSLSCKFCATGYMPRERNLTFDEIYDEVVLINQQSERIHGKKLTNIVFMGMGEPLLNYKHVLKAIERITAADGLAMSSRNSYLDVAQRKVSATIYATLTAAAEKLRRQAMSVHELEHRAAADLAAVGMRPEYFSVRRAVDLAPPQAGDRELIILAAAWLGSARLIDNIQVTLDQPFAA